MRARVLSWAGILAATGWGPVLVKLTGSWFAVAVVTAVNVAVMLVVLFLMWAVTRERPVAQADRSAYGGRR